MFVITLLLTLTAVLFLSVRDWISTREHSARSVRNKLKAVSQQISLQEWDKAQKELLPLIEKKQGGKEAALFEIQILRGTDHLQEALQKVSFSVREYPEELFFRLEEANILLDLDRASEALDAFRVCSPILREESDFLALGTALLRAGFSKQCLDLLKPWLQKSKNGQLSLLYAEALYSIKQFQEAIQYYNSALALGEKSHQVFLQLGHAYRRLGNLAKSEEIFRKLIEKDNGDIAATLGLGLCLQERGHFHKALLIYQSGLAWEKKDQDILYQSGLCALRTKKFSFAEFCFKELIQSQVNNPKFLAYYGLSLENQKKWQEAEQTYIRLIHLFPSYIPGYRALGWLFGVGLSKTLSPEEGLNFAHRAVKFKSDPISWEILSAAYARVGAFEKAYPIQLELAKKDKDPATRARRQQVLRNLRKRAPLEESHVLKALVA